MVYEGNPLLGTWHLVRWEIAYGDGRKPTLPFGAQATGLIQYSNDGFMNACIARGGRPHLSSASVRSAPEPERLAAFESYFQYAGPYEIRGEPGQQRVVHTVTHSLNPNFVGGKNDLSDRREGDRGGDRRPGGDRRDDRRGGGDNRGGGGRGGDNRGGGGAGRGR